jgi:hypothetical protein
MTIPEDDLEGLASLSGDVGCAFGHIPAGKGLV